MTEQWIEPEKFDHPLPRVKLNVEQWRIRIQLALSKAQTDIDNANTELDQLITEAEEALTQQRFKEE